MQVSINHPQNNPTWHFIAEFLLDEVNLDEFLASELTAGPLYQAMQERNVPVECIVRIKRTIAETIKGVTSSFNHSLSDLPVRISLFSNIKGTEYARYPGDQLHGAWGYYLIEKGRNFVDAPFRKSPRVVELYLYKEGE